MTRLRGLLLTLALVAGFALAALALWAGDVNYPVPPQTERLLYVRSPRAAARLALSFRGLAADVYWIRAVQHFGRDARDHTRTTGRFELLQPLLDLTTTLDPYFNIAYRFGAVFLARPTRDGGPGRPDQAIALLEKGLKETPNRWQYAYDAGFVYYIDVGDFHKAADWFRRAAALPGAPEWAAALAAQASAQGGDRRFARQLYMNLAGADQEYLRKDGVRGLAQIDALDAIDQLQAVVEAFHAARGAYPRSWDELVAARMLRGHPADDTGALFVYDASAHQVRLSPASSLAPLPTALGR